MQLSLLELLVGIVTTEWTIIMVSRLLFGRYLNEWYTRFGIWAVLSDISIIAFGFLLAMYLYRGDSLVTLTGVAVAIQVVHDILFYWGVIVPLPRGTNAIIDLLKHYGVEVGGAAVLGDSWMMVGSALFAWLASRQSVHVQWMLLAVGLYMLPYAIFLTKK